MNKTLKKRTDISGTEKATLLDDAKTVANQLNAQNDTILTELQQHDDKRAAVESILGEILMHKKRLNVRNR